MTQFLLFVLGFLITFGVLALLTGIKYARQFDKDK